MSVREKTVRIMAVAQRLSDRLGIAPGDIEASARGSDPVWAIVHTLELVADALESRKVITAKPGSFKAAVRVASDEDLMTFPGVGEKSLPAIREWATAPVTVEEQLEAETGSEFVQTGSEPPTFVETDQKATGKSK
jgi:hypothetical protein